APDEQDAERLTGERDGLRGDDHLGTNGDDERACDDEDRVAGPSRGALTDADRDEEIGEGDAALLGRAPVEAGYGDRHRGSGDGVVLGGRPNARSLAPRIGPATGQDA